jgi:hypothetical protein|tara:strand:+ start:75 stop:398 length:324 start_codon:yes stop_codon:yes gene_type:complete
MNPITDIVFTATWFLLLVWAIRTVSQGWSKPVRNYNAGTWTTKVTKRVHPEMQDVEPGEQLMGVTFESKTECDLEEYQDLKNRIEELKLELEDPWEDDDDGDIVVRR